MLFLQETFNQLCFFFPLYIPFFSYMRVTDFYILFSPFSTSFCYFSSLNGQTHLFSELSVSLQGWSLVWLNLLFWLFSFSIHFLLCWAIRFYMLFFDPKMLSFTWCVQVSGNLNNILTDIYDRYLTVNYLLSGPSILSDTKILPEYGLISLFIYSCP